MREIGSRLEHEIALGIIERYCSSATLLTENGWPGALVECSALELGQRAILQLHSRDYVGHDPQSASEAVTLEELVSATQTHGLAIVALEPFGLIESETRWSRAGALVGDSAWSRLLSWMLVEDPLREFIALWQAVLGQLSIRFAARFVAVLEKRSDANNAHVLARRDALEVLFTDRSEAVLRELFGAALDHWRERLATLLGYRPNLVVLFRLLTLLAPTAREGELRDWMPREIAAQLAILLERFCFDAAAMRAIADLETDPEIGPLLATRTGGSPHLAWDLLPFLLDDALRRGQT